MQNKIESILSFSLDDFCDFVGLSNYSKSSYNFYKRKIIEDINKKTEFTIYSNKSSHKENLISLSVIKNVKREYDLNEYELVEAEIKSNGLKLSLKQLIKSSEINYDIIKNYWNKDLRFLCQKFPHKERNELIIKYITHNAVPCYLVGSQYQPEYLKKDTL